MPASSHSLDRVSVTFDDDRAVADAGLLLTGTLVRRLLLEALVDGTVTAGPEASYPVPHAGCRGRLHRRRRLSRCDVAG